MDEIPKEYKTFKLSITNKFSGGIFDTKFLFNDSDLNFDNSINNINENNNGNNNNIKNISKKSYHLEDLFKFLKEKKHNNNNNSALIEIPKEEGFENYLDENCKEKYHFADYDAFVTGYIFIYLREYLGENYINEHINKINYSFGIYSCIDLNNDKVDEKYLKNSDEIFILCFDKKQIDFSAMKKIDDLLKSKLVETFLDGREKIFYTICFIKSENKNDFMKECEKLKEFFNINSLEQFKQNLLNGNKNLNKNFNKNNNFKEKGKGNKNKGKDNQKNIDDIINKINSKK